MFCYCFFPLNSIYFLAEKRLILELCHRVDGDKVSWVPTTKKVFAIFLKTISSTTKNVFAIILKTISSKTKVFLHYHQECISSSLKKNFFHQCSIYRFQTRVNFRISCMMLSVEQSCITESILKASATCKSKPYKLTYFFKAL